MSHTFPHSHIPVYKTSLAPGCPELYHWLVSVEPTSYVMGTSETDPRKMEAEEYAKTLRNEMPITASEQIAKDWETTHGNQHPAHINKWVSDVRSDLTRQTLSSATSKL
jgi:hypothetical protein